MFGRIKRDASVFVLLPLLIAGFSVDAGSAPFTNGDFEQGSVDPGNDRITLGVGDTSIAGWIVTAGDVDYTGGSFWQHSDGVRSVDVNGETQGALAQQFDTVVGQTYDVDFDMAGNPDGGAGIKYLLVTAPGFSQQFTFDTTGFSRADMGWSKRSFSFTADSPTSTILFESQTFDDCCYGPVLDNVRVAVPVPVISSVMVTNDASLQIDITGEYLSNGSDAVVSLGTVGTLSVDFQSSSELVATAFTPVPYGDYLLTLTNDLGSVTYDLTLGAVGPAGPPGPPGGLASDTGRNTAAGTDALANNTTGVSNSAFGRAALRDNTTGTRNTAIGNAALINNTTGQRNTATGETALRNNVSGFGNTATGSEALRNNSAGDSNTAMGFRALGLNQTGDWNTAIGSNALFKNTTASYNTASGAKALYSNTKGFHNTASGAQALRQNTTGSDNTASGTDALLRNTIGSRNTASGVRALQENTSGSGNTAVGFEALKFTTGFNNTASGALALKNNTRGGENTANGLLALSSNTTGSSNTAVGSTALLRNRTGFGNVAMGTRALENNETGRLNVAIGGLSLLGNGGDGNIALGWGAGLSTNGNDNIVIGNGGVSNESGAIRIGENSNHTRTFMAGIHNAGTADPTLPVCVSAGGQLVTEGCEVGRQGDPGANCWDAVPGGTSVADCEGDPGRSGMDGRPGANCWEAVPGGTSVADCKGEPGTNGTDGEPGANCWEAVPGGTSVADCKGDPGPPGTAAVAVRCPCEPAYLATLSALWTRDPDLNGGCTEKEEGFTPPDASMTIEVFSGPVYLLRAKAPLGDDKGFCSTTADQGREAKLDMTAEQQPVCKALMDSIFANCTTIIL